jgi:hypothetical protein
MKEAKKKSGTHDWCQRTTKAREAKHCGTVIGKIKTTLLSCPVVFLFEENQTYRYLIPS